MIFQILPVLLYWRYYSQSAICRKLICFITIAVYKSAGSYQLSVNIDYIHIVNDTHQQCNLIIRCEIRRQIEVSAYPCFRPGREP